MVSDLAKISYKFYLYILELFKPKQEDPPVPPELEEVISKITAAQNASRERLDQISTEAAALLRTLTEREAQQVARWKKGIEKLLKEEGVDSVCIDEFLKDPSLENLEELRKKYPGIPK